jgi:transcription initiation factor TFIID subunit 11
MASPPGATSPPGPAPLALPRQRPTLALPGGGSYVKSRKPSIASNTSSAHPLRQTSFPPEKNPLDSQHAEALAQFSPSQASFDEFSDSEIVSAISGPADDGAPRKRKRGDKSTRGRKKQAVARTGSVSVLGGEDGTPATARRGAPSLVEAENAEDEDDDEEEVGYGGGRVPLYEGGQMSAAEYETDNRQKAMFRQYMDMLDAQSLTAPGSEGLTVHDRAQRYDQHNRVKLRTADVRKLVNQTLSQSVPANVVTVVSAYTKTFAGSLIEEARKVQAEWLAMEEKKPDGSKNPAYERVRRAVGGGEGEKGSNGNIKVEQSSSPTEPGDAETNGRQGDEGIAELLKGGAGNLSTSIDECDRGPLLPDHLREALRRYKKSRRGGGVGFTGLSLEGREMAAPRLGGRRLFR